MSSITGVCRGAVILPSGGIFRAMHTDSIAMRTCANATLPFNPTAGLQTRCDVQLQVDVQWCARRCGVS